MIGPRVVITLSTMPPPPMIMVVESLSDAVSVIVTILKRSFSVVLVGEVCIPGLAVAVSLNTLMASDRFVGASVNSVKSVSKSVESAASMVLSVDSEIDIE